MDNQSGNNPYGNPNPQQGGGYPPPPGQSQPPPANYNQPGYPPPNNLPQPYYNQPGQYGYSPVPPPPPKKSNTGLIIGIIAGLVFVFIILPVIVVTILVLTGPQVGQVFSSVTSGFATTTTTSAASSTVVSTTGGEIATYPGATKVSLTDSVNKQFEGFTKIVPNSVLEGYKTSDSPDKVKSYYATALSKAGWIEATSSLGADNVKAIEGFGGTALAYTKTATTLYIVFAYPGVVATGNGITGVSSSDTFILVIKGKA